MKKINYDGKTFYQIPGYERYFINDDFQVIKQDKNNPHEYNLNFKDGYAYMSTFIRGKSLCVGVYDKCGKHRKQKIRTVQRLLFMAKNDMTDEEIKERYGNAKIYMINGELMPINEKILGELGKRVFERIRKKYDSELPKRRLEEMKVLVSIYDKLINEKDAEPLLQLLDRIKSEYLIPYLRKHGFGINSSSILAEETKSAVTESILKGSLINNLFDYMKKTARNIHARRNFVLWEDLNCCAVSDSASYEKEYDKYYQ